MWDLALFLYFTTSKTKIKQNHAPFCLSHFFNGSGKCSPLNSVKLSVCVCTRARVCSLWCGSAFPFSLVFVIQTNSKSFSRNASMNKFQTPNSPEPSERPIWQWNFKLNATKVARIIGWTSGTRRIKQPFVRAGSGNVGEMGGPVFGSVTSTRVWVCV